MFGSFVGSPLARMSGTEASVTAAVDRPCHKSHRNTEDNLKLSPLS